MRVKVGKNVRRREEGVDENGWGIGWVRGQKGSKIRQHNRADQGTLLMASEYSCHPFNSNNNDNKVSLVFIPSCQIHARDGLSAPSLA